MSAWTECHEEVTRRGELQPCDRPAVAMRLDFDGGDPYPVCAGHTRSPMVTLAAHEREVREQVAQEVRAEVEGWDRWCGTYARRKHKMYNLLADRIARGEQS